jgi:hypothetical protein
LAVEREAEGLSAILSSFAQDRITMVQERAVHEDWKRESRAEEMRLQDKLGELTAKVHAQQFAVTTIIEDHEALLRRVDTAAACAAENEARSASAVAQYDGLQHDLQSMTEDLKHIELATARARHEMAESERLCAEAEAASIEVRQRHAEALQACEETEAELASLSNQLKRSRAALKRTDVEQKQSIETFELELAELQLKQAERQALVERTDAIIAQRTAVEASWAQQRLAWKKDLERQQAQKHEWDAEAQAHAKLLAEHGKEVAGWKREADEMRKYRAVRILL